MIDGSQAPETALHIEQAHVGEDNASVTTPHMRNEQADEIKPPQFTENRTPTQGYEGTPDPDQNMMRMLAMQEEERNKMAEAMAKINEAKAHQTKDVTTPNEIPEQKPLQVSPQQIAEPKLTKGKGLGIKNFFGNLVAQLKLEKVVDVAKKIGAVPGKILSAIGKWWDVSSPKIIPPTRTPTTA